MLLCPSEDGCARVLLTNPSGCSLNIVEGTTLGTAVEATVTEPEVLEITDPLDPEVPNVRRVEQEVDVTTRKTAEVVPGPPLLTPEQKVEFQEFLQEHHEAFCLEPQERGETDLLEMETGDALPQRQAMRLSSSETWDN